LPDQISPFVENAVAAGLVAMQRALDVLA
jgi:hypothetical protein